jgi:formylglycine-generating enzyme required for sulfatase activity
LSPVEEAFLAKTFGKYEVVAELYATPEGSVFSARPVGEGAARTGAAAAAPAARELREVRYAVKVFNPTGLDLDELFWESQSFLERARLQQRTADAGNGHWAPVHEMGTSPAGAYYVTDFHPLSAASLVTGKIDVGPGVLYAIVRSVVSALAELKETAGRSHGNLKATNVLIRSRGDVAVAGAVVTDPAPSADAAKLGEAGDLYALGELIYLLVTARTFAGLTAWPVPPSREWNRLGSQYGKAWRRLCNDLLHPDPEARPASLSIVARQLNRLAPRRPKHTRKTLIAAVSAALFLALGAAATLVVQDVAARKELCTAKEHWAGALDGALLDPARRVKMESDPDLRVVVQELITARLDLFDCPAPRGRFTLASLLPALNPRQFRQTQETLAAVRRAERGLSPVRWRGLARAAELQGQFEGRGWNQPAAYLGERVAAARPGSTDLAGGIERLLRSLAAVDRDVDAAEAEWRHLQERQQELAASGDPLLKAFGALLHRTAAASVRLSESGFDNLDGLRGAASRAARLVDARRRLVPGEYDEERFAEAVARAFDPAKVQEADVQRWLDTMGAYAVRRQEIGAAAAALRGRADETAVEVLKTKPDADDAAAFELQKRKVDSLISLFQRRPFIAQDLSDGTFEAERKRVEAEVLALGRFGRREDPRKWIDALAALNSTSPRLNEAWESWRATINRSAEDLAREPDRFLVLRKTTQQFWNALAELDRAFPAPPKDLSAPFATAAARKREQALDGLLRTTEVSALDPSSPALKSAAAAFTQWSADLAELAKDFPISKELLTPEDRPDLKWQSAARSAFWNDAVVQSLVAADVARIERLRGLAGRPRAQLLEIASTTQVPEVALHAWRLLGTDSVSPAWPTQEADLKREADLRDRVADLLRQHVHRTAERVAPAEELARQGPLRWRRYAEAASNDKMVASAAQLRDAFGVDDEQFARLSPAARFNLSLYGALQRIRSPQPDDRDNDRAIESITEDLRKAADELQAQRPAAAELARRLKTMEEAKEPFADRKPGDVFELHPLNAETPLWFRRVEPASQGQRPFYLGTTEISLAQFADVVNKQAAWRNVRSLAWAPQPGEAGDARRGPRVWEWTAKPPQHMAATLLWLSPDDANNYPPEFLDPRQRFNHNLLSPALGGQPSDQHPMQYVSAEAALYFAALCGCRLPTTQEWQAAFEKYGKGVPAERWNLRDRTFDVQRRYAAASARDKSAQMPDAGIYLPPRGAKGRGGAALPDAGTIPAGAAARSGPQDDKTLVFRPVDAAPAGAGAGAGARVAADAFRNLIGNVAEYVCDAPQEFERASDKGTPQGARRFARENATSLAVIGGSALSPPELPLTEPLPVERSAAYADVGFRLAFTAPFRSASERLGWVLAGQEYVFPNPAAIPTTAGARAAAHE